MSGDAASVAVEPDGTTVLITSLPIGEYWSVVQAISTSVVLDGTTWLATVAHDDGCPCADGSHRLPSCTCSTVDVIMRRLVTPVV